MIGETSKSLANFCASACVSITVINNTSLLLLISDFIFQEPKSGSVNISLVQRLFLGTALAAKTCDAYHNYSEKKSSGEVFGLKCAWLLSTSIFLVIESPSLPH